jgi:CheY-like chemotaxis protein
VKWLRVDSCEASDRIGQLPVRILIIEDDPDMRELLIEVLESVGHEVLVADDGTQGLQMLREEAPDLVLTDIVMPNMDGLEFLQEIHSAESGSKIKTIAISGAPPQWMALKTAKDLGARKTLAKPFTRREIIEVVDTVLAGD